MRFSGAVPTALATLDRSPERGRGACERLSRVRAPASLISTRASVSELTSPHAAMVPDPEAGNPVAASARHPPRVTVA